MPTVLTGKSDTGGAAWAKLDVGVYPATLTSFESSPSAFEPDKERFQFNFTLDDQYEDDGETPVVMRYWANAVLSPRSTLASIIEAMGFAWTVGQGFDLDTLVGQPCRLMVGRKTPQGKTEAIAFVQSVVGPEAKTKAAPKKAAPTAAVAGDDGIGPCVSCGEPGTKFTGKGKPICEECAG